MRTERLEFYEPNTGDDGFGGVVAGFQASPTFSERAEMMYLRGSDAVQQSRMAGRQPVIAKVPSSTAARSVTAGWRMVLVRTGMAFEIKGSHLTDDRREVEILAEGGAEV